MYYLPNFNIPNPIDLSSIKQQTDRLNQLAKEKQELDKEINRLVLMQYALNQIK